MRTVLLALVLLFAAGSAHAKDVSFTLEDRERLIRLDNRVEDIDKRLIRVETKIEAIDKRFEQVDKRFGDMFTFLWMLVAIFTTTAIGNIGFAYWDRRTIIAKAKEETIAEIEKEGKLGTLVKALREISKNDLEVAKVLRQFNLL